MLYKDQDESTPLHAACAQGHVNIAQYLITECGCDPEIRDQDLCTPLIHACRAGHFGMATYLVREHNCNLELEDAHGYSPILMFYNDNKLNLVKYCVKHNPRNWKARIRLPQPDNPNPDRHATTTASPLYLPYLLGYLNMVKYLVGERGVDPRESTEKSDVHGECRSTSYVLEKIDMNESMQQRPNLLTQGAKCKGDKITRIESPLEVACAYGHLDIVQYQILMNKVDPTQSTILDLMFISCQEGHSNIIKLLLISKRVNLDVDDCYGNSLLHYATQGKNSSGAYTK